MGKNLKMELDETLFQYDAVCSGKSMIAIKCNGNKVIILDKNSLSEIATIILKTDFPIDYMHFSKNHYLYIQGKEGHSWYDINTGQEILEQHRHRYIREFFPASNMILSRKDGTLRMLTENGNEVLGRIYEDAITLDGKAAFLIKSQWGLYGVIDRNDGSELIPCKCTEYKKLNGHLIALKQNSKWAIIDLDNIKSQISFLYDDVMEFTGDLIPVKMGDWGYIDRTSRRIIIPCSYKNVLPFNGEQAAVEQRKKWGVINTKNEKIIKSVYDFIQPIPGGLYITWKDEYYDDILSYYSDHFRVINTEGHVLYFVRKEDYNSNFPYAVFHIRPQIHQERKYGLIDINTGIVVPCVYDFVYNDVSQGCVLVKKYDKYGMWSIRKGKQVVPCKYDWVGYPNSAELCGVRTLSGEKGVYDILRDTELIPFDLGSGYCLGRYPDESCDYIIKRFNSKYGLINRGGDIIFSYQCDDFSMINENLVAFKKYGKWGFFNAEGDPVLENIHIENETIKKQNAEAKTEMNEVVVSVAEEKQIDLDKLIDAVVVDGVITEKERAVILKKATAAGYDADEVEILLDGRLHEKQAAQKTEEKTTAQEPVVSPKKSSKQVANEADEEFSFGAKLWEPVKELLAAKKVNMKAPKTDQPWCVFKFKSLDAQICLVYKKNIATVQLETYSGEEVKTVLDRKIASAPADHVLKKVQPEQSKRNKDKWMWPIDNEIDKSDSNIVKWYVDILTAIYRIVEG